MPGFAGIIGKRVRFPRGPAAVISRAVSTMSLELSGKTETAEHVLCCCYKPEDLPVLSVSPLRKIESAYIVPCCFPGIWLPALSEQAVFFSVKRGGLEIKFKL